MADRMNGAPAGGEATPANNTEWTEMGQRASFGATRALPPAESSESGRLALPPAETEIGGSADRLALPSARDEASGSDGRLALPPVDSGRDGDSSSTDSRNTALSTEAEPGPQGVQGSQEQGVQGTQEQGLQGVQGEQEPGAQEQGLRAPLIAGNVSREAELKAAARDIGERYLQKELDSAKGLKGFFIKRWKGNYARKYYERKYAREAEGWIAAAERGETARDRRGREVEITADDWQRERKWSVKRAIDDELDAYQDYLSTEVGEKRLDENAELTQIVRAEIEGFVQRAQQAETLEDRQQEETNMRAAMKNLSRIALAKKATGDLENIEGDGREQISEKQIGNLNNYAEVAIEALRRVEHGMALENVMEGFKVVNARVNEGARTEVHQDAIDKIVSAWEGSRFGHLIPPETIAGAAGVAGYFSKRLATNAVKAATLGIGGSAVTGVLAGARERSHVTADRQRMMRDLSGGLRKMGDSKYEAKIFETRYDMMSVDALVEEMNEAQESGDIDAITKALIEAQARLDFSDQEKKDLIFYSSPEQRSREHLGLLVKMSTLKKGMTEEQLSQFNQARSQLVQERMNELEQSTKAKDRVFAKLRRKQALKQGVKTGVTSFAAMTAVQEVAAIFDPGKYGALEGVLNKNGVLSTVNSESANETMLAGLTGQHQEVVTTSQISRTVNGVLTDQEKANLQARGGSYHEYREPSTVVTEERTATYVAGEKVPGVSGLYTTEDWGSSGTGVPSGNELGIWNGPRPGTFITHMSGDSFTDGHGTMNFEDDVANGRLMGYLTVDRGAQAIRIPITPEVTSDGQLLFDDPILRQFVDENGNFHGAFFEVAKEAGVDEDGVTHLVSYATEVGDGTVSTFDVTEMVDVVTPGAEMTAIIEPQVDTSVVEADAVWGPFAVFLKRNNLSRMTRGGNEAGGERNEMTVERNGSAVERVPERLWEEWWNSVDETARNGLRRLANDGVIVNNDAELTEWIRNRAG